jgi:hypothetical protein
MRTGIVLSAVMSASAPVEPAASAFFASPGGVGVYVAAGQRAIRVDFESLEAGGTVTESDELAHTALLLARAAFCKHRAVVAPLFQVAEREWKDGKSSLGSSNCLVKGD